jgi:hypothetical protein
LDTGSKNHYEKTKTDLADISIISDHHHHFSVPGSLVFQPPFPAVFSGKHGKRTDGPGAAD